MKKALIAGVVLGSLLIAASIYALSRTYRFDRKEKVYRLKIEKFLEDYKALKPMRFSYADTNNKPV